MRRKPCSSTWKRTHAAGLCLSVYFSVYFHVLFITSSSAHAGERAPFDLLFARATGQGLKDIATPLNWRINEIFIRAPVASNAVAESLVPDATPPVQPVASEATSPPQNTSSTGNGLIADLLRLFGFNANDSTDTVDRRKITERNARGFSEEPPAVQGPESPAELEMSYGVQKTEHAIMASPLLMCAMILIAATFTLRHSRRGGATYVIAGGVLTGFILYFFSDIVFALGQTDSIPVVLAAWTPSGVATLLGLAMLLHLEDG